MTHPLAALVRAAARGDFPAADGGWHRVPPWRPGLGAVLGFTGHAVLAVGDDVPTALLNSLGVDGFGGAHAPAVALALAGDGWIDSLDVLLVARGGEPDATPLVPRADLAEHPRVALARRLRDDVAVFGVDGPDRSLVTLGRGLAGLPEISFELAEHRRGARDGAAWARAARALAPPGEVVVAAVAPGNAASLRALLAGGFAPVASVQLFTPVGA